MTHGDEPTVPSRGGPQRDDQPATIGRYRVLRQLGAGGMGVVYAAHDPDLDRTVAIKLVRERLGGVGAALRERLRREAQALARLSHPNVVSIHDVGVDGDQLFIVMQYVDGAVLDDWIAEHQPGREGVIALYLQAGRGLAAAHAAGLVHRDFKPGNVLVEAGVAKVTDFGLVRLSHLGDEPLDSGSGSGDPLNDSMTRGDVVGTPAYMAPEQFLDGAITGATDQFGFCVALWEALTGARPFAGGSLEAIRRAVLLGEVAAPARAMPQRIVRALRRGLSAKAADRHPDMAALLAALESPRRWWLAAAAAIALTGTGALAAVVLSGGGAAAANPCGGVAAPMDALWTAARRDDLHATLAGAATADDPSIADDVIARLDQRAARWRTVRADACEATHVHHSQPDAVMALRVGCLDRSLDAMQASLDELGRAVADPQTLSRARAIATAGLDGASCTAERVADDAARPLPQALAVRFAELEARNGASDWKFVHAAGPGVAAELEAAGAVHDAARAYFLVACGTTSVTSDEGRAGCRKAALLAEQSSDDTLAARAWSWGALHAGDAGDEHGADDLLAMADAAATRSGDPLARLAVAGERGDLAERRGDFDGSIAICRKSYDEATRLGLDLIIDDALTCLTTAYLATDAFDDAAPVERELLALRQRTGGPDSGETLHVELQLAQLAYLRGDREAAHTAMRSAIERMARIEGAESPDVIDAWSDIALDLSESSTIASPDALAAIDTAVALGTKTMPPDDPALARLLEIQGNLAYLGGEHARGMAAYEAGLAIYDHSNDLRRWARLAYNAADGYRQDQRCDRAIPMFERIIRISDAGDVDLVFGAGARGGLGLCLDAVGRRDEAVATLERAVRDLDTAEQPDLAATYRIYLAQIEQKRGHGAAARALAKQVKAMLPADSEGRRDTLKGADEILNGR